MARSDFYTCLRNPESSDEDSLSLLKDIVAHYPSFHTAWILLLKNMKKFEDPRFDDFLREGAFRVTDRSKLYRLLMEEKITVSDTQTSQAPDALSREYASAETYARSVEEEQSRGSTLRDLARSIGDRQKRQGMNETVAEDDFKSDKSDFVTETLAKIYAKQGLYKEALQVYEKLSLRYPEKNVYFASKIEEVKKMS